MQTAQQAQEIAKQWTKDRAPKEWLDENGGIKPEFAQELDAFIHEQCSGIYSEQSLDLGVLFFNMNKRQKAQFQRELDKRIAEEKQNQFAKDVEKWVQQHPNFLQTDDALAVAKDYFDKHPDATVQDWDFFASELNMANPKLWKQPKKLVLNVRNATPDQLRQMRQVYGDGLVDEALQALESGIRKAASTDRGLETPRQAEERRKQQQSDEQSFKSFKDEQADKQAKEAAEMVVFGFSGRSHADTQRGRKILEGIVVYRDNNVVDHQKTTEARKAWVANYEGKNPSIVMGNAR